MYNGHIVCTCVGGYCAEATVTPTVKAAERVTENGFPQRRHADGKKSCDDPSSITQTPLFDQRYPEIMLKRMPTSIRKAA